MRNIILKDIPETRNNLLPLTFTRPVADLRIGILTLREKWETLLPGVYSYITEDYLSIKYPCISSPDGDNIIISAHFFPTPMVIQGIESLMPGQALAYQGEIIAARGINDATGYELIEFEEIPSFIRMLYELILRIDMTHEFVFHLITDGRQ